MQYAEDGKPIIRISSTADIVDAVPYLVGFQPTDSLVLLVTNDTQLTVTARMDLPDTADDVDTAETLEVIAQRWPDAVVIALTYADDVDPRVCYAMSLVAEHLTVDVPGWITVNPTAGTWRVGSEAGSLDPSSAASLTLAMATGTDPQSTREDLEQVYTAGVETDPAQVQSALQVVDGFSDLGALLRYASRDSDPKEARDQLLPVLWACPAPLAGDLYGLIGLLSWAIGDGAVAQICAGRGRGSVLAQITDDLIVRVADPREKWESLKGFLANQATQFAGME